MLSTDLAKLYGVERRALLQAVKRNSRRFPPDFMFQLTRTEQANLKSQSVISSPEHGGSRHAPYAFTEHGVAMLSSVLRSAKAIEVNIRIVRAFVQLRGFVLGNKELTQRLAELFLALEELMTDPRRLQVGALNLKSHSVISKPRHG